MECCVENRDREAEPDQHLTPIINMHVVSCLEEKRRRQRGGTHLSHQSLHPHTVMCTLLLAYKRRAHVFRAGSNE